MNFTRVATALAAMALVCTRASAGDMPLPIPSPPILLRLDASIEPSREVADAKGFAAVLLGFPGRDTNELRWLAAEKARTIGADSGVDGKDVLNWVAPLRPNLLVTGPKSLVDPILAAPEGTKVRMEGLVNRGSQTYYLRSAKVGPDAWDDDK